MLLSLDGEIEPIDIEDFEERVSKLGWYDDLPLVVKRSLYDLGDCSKDMKKGVHIFEDEQTELFDYRCGNCRKEDLSPIIFGNYTLRQMFYKEAEEKLIKKLDSIVRSMGIKPGEHVPNTVFAVYERKLAELDEYVEERRQKCLQARANKRHGNDAVQELKWEKKLEEMESFSF
ncbi:MAG: hypothetical protein IJS68_01795 [Clostridia bacterium]|nr:hypothetical protein [Clostridia bacterium]